MSDEQVEQSEQVEETNSQPEEPKDPPGITMSSSQLKERLDRARETEQKKLLSALGVDDLNAAKAALKAQREREEEQMSLEQRLSAVESERAKQTAQLERYRAAVEAQSESVMSDLTEAQRNAVLAVAGDDPAMRLQTVAALRPTWVTADPVEPIAPPAPVNTAPPRSQPSDSTADVSQPNHAEVYRRLKSDPKTAAAAAVYMNRYSTQILAQS